MTLFIIKATELALGSILGLFLLLICLLSGPAGWAVFFILAFSLKAAYYGG